MGKAIVFTNKREIRTGLLYCALSAEELSKITRAGWLKPYALLFLALKSEAEGNEIVMINKNNLCEKWKIKRRYLPGYLETLQNERLVQILASNRSYYTVKFLKTGGDVT